MTGEPRPLLGVWLGTRRYEPIYALQKALVALRKQSAVTDLALLLEHAPVITLGRGAVAGHLLESRQALAARGVEVHEVDRGGEVTLHVPGQLVAYPIVQLAPDRCDVRRYVRDLMEVMRRLVEGYGIAAGEASHGVGLWVDAARPDCYRAEAPSLAKIGAIGVRISRWVTMHGFALNLRPSLSLYGSIVPCGIREFGVCSVESVVGARPAPREVAPSACRALCERLERDGAGLLDLRECEEGQLLSAIAAAAAP